MAKKILIVDDDKDLVESLSQVLQSRGYETAAAYSAAEGLKTLLAEKPDLVILDVMMETDTAGFEAAGQIRSARPFSRYRDVRTVPLIILTAIGQVTNSRFSLDPGDSFLPGVNAFLTKPVDLDELVQKIAALLG
ncbi:MAG: response regulator [Acidobacteriota bacterium]|jgi:CheY-like chemotaxis protein|nr:response regulator [Acidobacteriota bacterium]OQB58677.1 MAG: Response regulator MprA [Candidatus Aminicenantes bacterium ADurb.Bin147]HNQ80932.1 response regulator [Candidatus Aminicenantes bacterium]MDD8010229.1 response regulator [Acidobacteriota bacterium]MDD8028511.1 response regulator [Acidobacteriota bacterium]